MPETLVQADWSSGNLRLKDASGNVIATFESANRALDIPSGSVLDVSGATGATQPDAIVYVLGMRVA